MDFFDRHKALIITSLLFSVIILALYSFTLSSNNQKVRELLVDLDNFKAEQLKEEEPEPEETPVATTRPTTQTHQAFNENTEARNENFDQQLQEIFEKNSASQEETSEEENTATTGAYGMRSSASQETKKRSDGDRTTQKISTQKGGIDRSSISFNLVGRTAVDLPNPIYTCDRSGKVVVNITVDDRGRVMTTSINKASSTTSNECLAEQALLYASQAVFSSLAGRKNQPGTITYNFKP